MSSPKINKPIDRIEFQPNFYGLALSLGSSGILGPDVAKFCKHALSVGWKVDDAFRKFMEEYPQLFTKNQP